MKQANNEKLAQKQENDGVIDLQERMDKIILKVATLKSSARLNMQQLVEVHDEVMNDSKDNGTTETIEELYKLRQTLK